jgi:hypothetical protein
VIFTQVGSDVGRRGSRIPAAVGFIRAAQLGMHAQIILERDCRRQPPP